jgi:hypothetical protein
MSALPDFSQWCEQARIKLWGEPDKRTQKELPLGWRRCFRSHPQSEKAPLVRRRRRARRLDGGYWRVEGVSR